MDRLARQRRQRMEQIRENNLSGTELVNDVNKVNEEFDKRMDRVASIANRYQKNIRNTKSFKNGVMRDREYYGSGENDYGDNENRYYRRYSRNTYMGLSNG